MHIASNMMIIRSLMLVALLSIAACAVPGSTARPPASPTPASVEQVEFNGISVSYPSTFATHVKTRFVSGEEYMGTPLPDYIQVSFDDNARGGIVARQAGLRVFRVRDLQEVNWMYKAAVIAHEPMPLLNGTRVLRVQDKLLSFLNGKGERAIVHYAQDIGPLTNEGLFYSYQGLTDNGLYYVSATFPVSVTFLPKTLADGFPGMPSTAPGDLGYQEAYFEAVNRFNHDATEHLEQLDAAGYQPNLQTLDAVIRSLSAGESPQWSTTPEQ